MVQLFILICFRFARRRRTFQDIFRFERRRTTFQDRVLIGGSTTRSCVDGGSSAQFCFDVDERMQIRIMINVQVRKWIKRVLKVIVEFGAVLRGFYGCCETCSRCLACLARRRHGHKTNAKHMSCERTISCEHFCRNWRFSSMRAPSPSTSSRGHPCSGLGFG